MVRIEPILLDGERWGQGAFPDMIAVVLTSSKEYFATGLYMGYPLIHVPKDSMYSTSRVRVIEGKEKEKVKFLRTSFTILIDASKDKVSKVIDALLSIANMRLHSLQPEDFIKALRRDVYYTVARCLGGVKYREFRMGTVPAWGVPTLDSEFLVVFSAGGVLDSVVPRFWRERTDILEMLMMVFPWFNLSPMDRYDQAPMDFGHIDYCLSFSSTPLVIGNFQREFLTGQKPTSATLCYRRCMKAFSINIVVNREMPLPPQNGNVIGVDRGIYNLATTSSGLRFSGRQAMHVRRRYARLRQALQAKGTKGAKRLLQRLSGRKRRFIADLNHRIAKAIVNSCKPGDVIVMEDLRYIRERIRAAKEQRLLQHSWAFGQLGKCIEYKATERGIRVVYVDPRHTSQRCPRCGCTNRSNRHGHLFRCTSCGFVGHADIVAATNIRQVFLDTLADGPPSVGPEAASSRKPRAFAMG